MRGSNAMRTERPTIVPPSSPSGCLRDPACAPRDDPQVALVDAIANPAVLIELDGWVRATNRAGASSFGAGGLLAMRSGRLEPACPARRDAWLRLLDEAQHSGRADGELGADDVPVPVRVVRLGPQRLLAILQTPAARRAPAADPVDAFAADAGLTHSETAVLRGLLAGHAVRAIASLRATTEATVRSQVRALLAKTGSTSIRNLVLTVLSPPQADDLARRGGHARRS
jgi:DNA-binding CsgD family transcriptional regulator